MSDEDLKKTLAAMEAVRAEFGGSKEKALDFLVKAGIATPSGELNENYKQGA